MTRTLTNLLLCAAAATGAIACNRATAATVHDVGPPVAHFDDRDEYVYDVHLTSQSEAFGSTGPIAFDLGGKLLLRSRAEGSTVRFRASMISVNVRQTSGPADQFPPALASELGGPWGFELDDGRARTLELRGRPSPFAVGIMSTLVSPFQHPDARKTSDVVEDDETDGTGNYRARYTRTQPGKFEKAKLAYDAVSFPTPVSLGPLTFTPQITASKQALTFSDGALAATTAHEELELHLSGKSGIHAVTDMTISLVGHARAPDALDWRAFLASTAAHAIGRPIPTQSPTRTADAADIEGIGFVDALHALEHEDAQAKKEPHHRGDEPTETPADRAVLHAFRTMVTLLRARPGTVALVANAIEQHSPASEALLDALGSSGTPEAQAVLIKDMNDVRSPEPLRREAAFALVRTPAPTPVSVDALLDALSEPALHDYAVYGLGTYSRRLREAGDTGNASRATSKLLSLLAATPKDSSSLVDVLRGIANSGDVTAFSAVAPLLDDTNPSTRAAAVSSLRLMQIGDVDGLVAARLADDARAVRLSALDAAEIRGPSATLAPSVSRVATTSPHLETRLAAVRVLGKWLPQRPELRSVLEGIVHNNDEEESVRKAAKASL